MRLWLKTVIMAGSTSYNGYCDEASRVALDFEQTEEQDLVHKWFPFPKQGVALGEPPGDRSITGGKQATARRR